MGPRHLLHAPTYCRSDLETSRKSVASVRSQQAAEWEAGNRCEWFTGQLSVRIEVAVDKAWTTALAAGAKDQGKPGIRHLYASDFYAAYCFDPEGHKLCFVHTDG